MAVEHRCVIVGPGRSRNGLGPFLASFLEEAGLRVVAGVGRDRARSQAACASLGERLGHGVEAFDTVDAALAATRPDLLVVASPVATHIRALEEALRARVAVFCEKPLVPYGRAAEGRALVDAFAGAGLLLAENCQWTEVLPAFRRLLPGTPAGRPRSVAMRLSPSGTGRAMVEDSLSHLLSVLQELGVLAPGTRIAEPRYVGASAFAVAVELLFTVVGGPDPVACRLALRRVEGQPRPAWLEIDGRRADRRIDPAAYSMRLAAGDGSEVPLDDPLRGLVYGVAADLRNPRLERLRHHSERIRARIDAYEELVGAWPAPGRAGPR
jgi:hypothetical protein